ncbi:hypothetical protein GYMLUDRAFT_48655 [Collybiopsis luxurians FD-317 M1]|uniref:Uncharacterized protein n=1 Tax=Collybiopsis luxurians FD-317 M1 TaxID=944289 RepID=A0A0D0AVL6_9AGAR|nr:hypothetical protein GYMLUDRAFT_48655 [Collybiopsis luxurians FD-317 M1]
MSLLAPVVGIYSYALQPIAPFTWFGIPLSTLDVLAAFRLCLVLRQIREDLYRKHVKAHGHTAVESRSFVRSASTALTVVFGGEAMACPYLMVPPSFMVSGVIPAFYTLMQGIVDMIPSVPEFFFEMELPLSVFDGFSRAYLLCDLIPPMVTMNPSPGLSSSPWTLLVTSFVATNGGFFLTNLFSFMNPTPLALQTPPELQPYGWTTADLWCAPLITGLYALLTHAQPFWAESHTLLTVLMGAGSQGKSVEPVDPATARALCAVLLACLFTGRTVKNFTNVFNRPALKKEPKLKTQ